MFVQDQTERRQILHTIETHGRDSAEATAAFKELEQADIVRVERLLSMVRADGWPLRSVVGQSASTAAWTILQHAELSTQKQLAPLIDAAVARGEARADEAAFLADRIAAGDGACQRYGTQVSQNDDGTNVFHPICDPGKVDELRKQVGLEPLAEYAKSFSIDPATWRGQLP